MEPPVPNDEAARLHALRSLEVLDSTPEADFDDIVALASEMCSAPVSLVSLVDAQRQWFKARVGITVDETSRDVSFCAHAILGRDLMVVPDATADSRFADNPFVRADGGIRFYAGAPLITSDGCAVGTLCVVDHLPHKINLDQIRALRALARLVSEYLELRRITMVTASPPIVAAREVDLGYLLEGAIRDIRPIADGRNTAITLARPDAAGPAQASVVRAEPTVLRHALDYVMFTAIKAAPSGGKVAVRVRQSRDADTGPAMEISHAGGSIVPAWLADLAQGRPAAEPVPAAVAAALRAHGVHGEAIDSRGSPDAALRLTFPPA